MLLQSLRRAFGRAPRAIETTKRGERMLNRRRRSDDPRHTLRHAVHLALDGLETRTLLACEPAGGFTFDREYFRDFNNPNFPTLNLSVAVQGDLIAVGLPNEGPNGEGVVRLIDRVTGNVLADREIANPDAADPNFDAFGRSLAFLENGTLLVGAPGDNIVGSAWIIDVTTGQAIGNRISNPNPGDTFNFGDYVYAYGNQPLVHSVFLNGQTTYGVLNVYSGSSLVHSLTSGQHEDGEYDSFGEAVAINAQTVMVGSQNINRVFRYDGLADDTKDGAIAEPATSIAPVGGFGSSVAFTPDGRLVVGARGELDLLGTPLAKRGAVYLFNADLAAATPIQHRDAQTDPNPPDADAFGNALAVRGNQLVIGASGHHEAFAYNLDNLSAPPQLLDIPGEQQADAFGSDLAFAANDLVVGADGFGVGGVFLFRAGGTAATPPTAILTGTYTGTEGSPISFDASNSTGCDPLTFEWDLDYDGSNFDTDDTRAAFTHAFTDNTTRTIAVRVSNAAGSSIAATTLSVANVNPTATLSPVSGPEGAPITVSLSDVLEPGADDLAAGLRYAFSVSGGSLPLTYDEAGASPSADFTFDDNGTYVVFARVFDKDNGFTTYQTAVTVHNVAPTGDFNAPDVNEGDDLVISLDNATDPSSADAAEGFEYAFDVGDGNGYSAYGSATSVSIATDDNGARLVKVLVRDKDGGETEYSRLVTVSNVAPVAIASGADPGTTLADYTIAVGATDVSSADTAAGFTYLIDWGDGTLPGSSPSHLYAHGGQYTITVVAIDKDGGHSDPVTLAARVTGTTAAGQNLVFGTDADDDVALSPGSVVVTLNGVQVASFTNGNPITIHLGEGNDTLTTSSAIATPLTVFGGPGNDTLTGGAGDDLLDGGEGIDQLIGGGGNDSFASALGAISFTGHSTAARREFLTYVASVVGSTPTSVTYQVRTAAGLPVASGDGDEFDHAFTSTGQYTVTFTLSDGVNSTSVTRPVSVSVVNLRDGILSAGARTAGSKIDVKRDTSTNSLRVVVDGVSYAYSPSQTAGIARVVVYGSDANDDIAAQASVARPVEFYGGAGDDRLKGGGDDDILVGGLGDDALVGNAGNDVVIGGDGEDRIIGNTNDDILIAGTTDYDADPDALRAISSLWSNELLSPSQRVSQLRAGVNGVRLSGLETAYDDDDRDIITGGGGADWFFFNWDDQVTDLHYWEFVDILYLVDPEAAC